MINTIRWSKNQLMIDNRDITYHFEDAFQKAIGSNKPWPYKRDVFIQKDLVENSKYEEGEYMIFVSKQMFEEGYDSAAGVGLSSVNVCHENEYIIWEMDTPIDYTLDNLEDKALKFKFDKQQYLML